MVDDLGLCLDKGRVQRVGKFVDDDFDQF